MEYNDLLFFKVFRNIVIYSEIIKHLDIYKQCYKYSRKKKYSFNSETLSKFKYKEYLSTIHFCPISFEYDPYDSDVKQSITVSLMNNKRENKIKQRLEFGFENYNGSIPESCEKLIYYENIINLNFINFINNNGNLKELEFSNYFNKEIKSDYLLSKLTSIEKLVFGSTFNSNIESNSLPILLKSLTLGFHFNNKSIFSKDVLPSNLESLKFGYHFSIKIKSNSLPCNLKLLKFQGLYNKPFKINSLPIGLTSLTVGSAYNCKIPDNALPITLIYLSLGYNYNHKFNNVILYRLINLKELLLPKGYNHQITENTLPPNITSLSIGVANFQLPILPLKLEILMFNTYSHFNQPLINNLPLSLKHISFGKFFNNLVDPNLPNLTSLKYIVKNISITGTPTELSNFISIENNKIIQNNLNHKENSNNNDKPKCKIN